MHFDEVTRNAFLNLFLQSQFLGALKMLRAEIHFTNSRTEEIVGVPIFLWESSFPETVRNFVFACKAHLLSEEDRRARQEGEIEKKLPPPLLGSSVLRVDSSATVEFGTSATSSIFGGFFPDEEDLRQQDLLSGKKSRAALGPRLGGQEYTAGSLVMSNVGPNTNGSRFILLLAAAPELRGTHVCFGHVARATDVELLCSFFNALKVKVNPKTLVPLNKITVSSCHVLRSAARDAPTDAPRQISGVVRRRDDDSDEQDADNNEALSRRHEEDRETGQRALKKRRSEIVTVNAEGEIAPVTTAAPTPVGQHFDMFAAQEAAFHNDLLDIKQSQLRKQHNHQNKQARFAAHSGKKNKSKPRRY